MLEPVQYPATTDPATGHGIHETVDRIEVCAEESVAEVLVTESVVEQVPRDVHDLIFERHRPDSRQAKKRVAAPGKTLKFGLRA